MNLPALPTHKNAPTGNPVLDRIQNNVRDLLAFVRELAAHVSGRVAVVTDRDFTTPSLEAVRTPLRFRVKKGEVWAFQFFGFGGSTATTNGMKYGVALPTNSKLEAILDSSATGATDDQRLQITAPNVLTAAVHALASAGTRDDSIVGRFEAADDGEFAILMAAVTSGTATLRSFALLLAERVMKVSP